MNALLKLPLASTRYPVTIGASRPNTLPPRTRNAKARPASAGERSRSLVSVALAAGPALAKETVIDIKMMIAVSDST